MIHSVDFPCQRHTAMQCLVFPEILYAPYSMIYRVQLFSFPTQLFRQIKDRLKIRRHFNSHLTCGRGECMFISRKEFVLRLPNTSTAPTLWLNMCHCKVHLTCLPDSGSHYQGVIKRGPSASIFLLESNGHFHFEDVHRPPWAKGPSLLSIAWSPPMIEIWEITHPCGEEVHHHIPIPEPLGIPLLCNNHRLLQQTRLLPFFTSCLFTLNYCFSSGAQTPRRAYRGRAPPGCAKCNSSYSTLWENSHLLYCLFTTFSWDPIR